MKHRLAVTKNNIAVYVDLIHSAAAAHISQQPYLLELVKEVLQTVVAKNDTLNFEYNMNRSVGYDFHIETSGKETIFYARLIKDKTYTRFVKNGAPQTTQYLTIVLRRDEEHNYELCDTWIGRLRPPRPGSPDENAESKTYWSNHAVVFVNQSLQFSTVTKNCPY
jgi:hypothetical protein